MHPNPLDEAPERQEEGEEEEEEEEKIKTENNASTEKRGCLQPMKSTRGTSG